MEEYIGREVKAFEFEGDPGMSNDMKKKKRIGQIGVIKSFSSNTFKLAFSDGQAWYYPNDQLIENLVEPEPELTLDEILEQIKNLKP